MNKTILGAVGGGIAGFLLGGPIGAIVGIMAGGAGGNLIDSNSAAQAQAALGAPTVIVPIPQSSPPVSRDSSSLSGQNTFSPSAVQATAKARGLRISAGDLNPDPSLPLGTLIPSGTLVADVDIVARDFASSAAYQVIFVSPDAHTIVVRYFDFAATNHPQGSIPNGPLFVQL